MTAAADNISSMTKVTHRAFRGWARISTAIVLPSEVLLQVFPFKQEFATVAEWKKAWPAATRFRTTGLPTGYSRREAEFGEFVHSDNSWLISSVQRIGKDSVRLTLNDGSTAVITRSLNFAEPPVVSREGVTFIDGTRRYKSDMSCARMLSHYLFT
jgi:hypothetical protein